MQLTSKWLSVPAFAFLLSCTQYTGGGFKGGSKKEETASSPGPVAGENATPQPPGSSDPVVSTDTPIVANTPTEAQRDGKTFLALSDKQKLHGLKSGQEQMATICPKLLAMPNIANHFVIQRLCVQNVRPRSLIELQQVLNLAVVNPALVNRNQNATGGNPGFVFQGHSSSLVGRFVSAINPRVILYSPQAINAADPDYVMMGFVRGEQFVEIAINSPLGPEFLLVGFKQACNSRPTGCNAGELLTPYIESNWTEFSLYHEDELKNSIVDCRHCHQPTANGPKLLRMQELRDPWTHFFRDNRSGNALITDYYAAHGTDETYGGIPGPMIRASEPADLEDALIANGFENQPNEFPGNVIANQVEATSAAQPEDNTIPGVSQAWQNIFNAVLAGDAIPVPYHDVKVTEPALLAQFTRQYQDFRAGVITMEQFQDHRNVLRTDQTQLANMGFAVAPNMTPQQTMMLACAQCHNNRVDQTISRARFNVNLAAMPNPAIGIDQAIARLRLGYTPQRLKAEGVRIISPTGAPVELEKGEHLLTMPPRRFKQLTDAQIDALIRYLEEQKAILAR